MMTKAAPRLLIHSLLLFLLALALAPVLAAQDGGFAVVAEQRSVVQDLLDLELPPPGRSPLGLRLTLERMRSGRAFVEAGRPFRVTARADAEAVLVLLNVDREGTVSVLYPVDASETSPRISFEETFQAVPPFGGEVLKLFAFREAPAGLGAFVGVRLRVGEEDSAGDERLEKLYEILREGDGQTWITVVSDGVSEEVEETS